LAVTTNFESICRYSTTSGFSFANGTPMTTNDNYSHSVSIAALADATYTFYAICKDNNKGMTSSQLEIITTLDRPDTVNSQPEITNITAGYQTNSEVILSVTTKAPAKLPVFKNQFRIRERHGVFNNRFDCPWRGNFRFNKRKLFLSCRLQGLGVGRDEFRYNTDNLYGRDQ